MMKVKSIMKNYLNRKDNRYCVYGKWIDLNKSQKEYLRKKVSFLPLKSAIVVPFSLVISETIGTKRYGIFIDLLCKVLFVLLIMFVFEYLTYDITAERLLKLKDDE